ncbi:MAG: chromate transporter [Myxococcota bacterium]
MNADSQGTEDPPETTRRPRVAAWRLLKTFALVGLCAFGGVMPWVYRAVVEKEQWLGKEEFAELWGQGLMIPGATSTNVAATVGYRLNGARGAAAAVVGLMGPPFVIVIFMAELYQRYGSVPAVHGAVRGVTAVAAGLVIATGVKLALGQPRRASLVVFGLAALAGVTVFRFPLVAVIGVLLPLSFVVAWRASR